MASKIVYVHGISEMGGAEKDLLSYLDLLDRNEFCPHVVCPGVGDFFIEVKKRHIPVEAVYIPPWRKLKGLVKAPFFILRLVRIFRQWKVDLVHVNDYWWFPQTYLAALICGLPIVVHLRQQIERERVKQYWLEKPDYLFPVSKDIEGILLSSKIEPNKIHLLYSGIDINFFQIFAKSEKIFKEYGIRNDQLIIGVVANVFPRKGYEYLIQSLGKVKKLFPDFCCFIVGEGPKSYRAKLDQIIVDNKLQHNVIFAGFQKNVIDYLNIFDVFVLPSLMEGFGIALLEAMAMRKAIVACNVGGIPEAIKDGETGLLVPPKNPEALGVAILKLIANKELRERFGNTSRKVVEENFSQQMAVEKISKFYRLVINRWQ